MSEIKEVTGYSGTTIKNFARCARLDDNGNVVYDKNDKKGQMPHVYFSLGVIGALEFALPDAFEAKDIPVVLIGRVPVSSFEPAYAGYRLKKGLTFPVSMLLAPIGNLPLNYILESVMHYVSEETTQLPSFYVKHHPGMLLKNLLPTSGVDMY